ncbi:potassium voltage-gated channel subfamily A member 1-like [Rhopilema esculentum]|uniref:potassium voltage-gated channel subfamily A member 1-like n=1 Tax=Rhopilema esculentum TaxID=499914 RepID=UPI0031E3CEF1
MESTPILSCKMNGINSEPKIENEVASSQITDEQIIKINVSGFVYETLEATITKFPNTLLGNEKLRKRYFVESRGTYFFDRSRTAFEAILAYYQTGGVLIRPPTIPMKLFAKEVLFYQLGEEVFLQLQKDEGFIQDTQLEMPKNRYQRAVWELFECPDSSLAARLLAVWSVIVIVVSITIFCIETLPGIKKQQGGDKGEQQPWVTFEIVCISWFTIEYVGRLLASPSKLRFARSFLNIIDLAAILPYFITLPMDSAKAAPLSVLRVIRLVRVFRIFKLSRHSTGLRILGYTLRESSRELGMLMFFLVLGIILFSSGIYYAEFADNEENFPSIPDTFWYSLVTMTTVGYGDKVPKTPTGKLIGSLCAIVGVLTIALPVPVIVSNFEFFYKRDRFTYQELCLSLDEEEKVNNTNYKRYEYLKETNV